MKTIAAENSKPHSQRSKWRESSERLFRSFPRFWLILFALVALAPTARACHIVGVMDCNCTNLTIELGNFPEGPLVATLGGVALDGIYDYQHQKIVVSRPAGLSAGNYLLSISKWDEILASANVFLCDCITNCITCTNCPAGPPGPSGPVGPTGATGAVGPAGPAGTNGLNGTNGLDGVAGPAGPKGDTGATGLTGAMGPAGPMGPKGDTGATGPEGPAGTGGGTVGPAGPAGLNGTNGLDGVAGPAGPKGDTGATGLAGPAGTIGPAGATGPKGDTGATGLTGATGPAGPAGTNGLNGTSGSSEYGYIYNLSAQVVPLETAVIFSDNGVHSAGITHALGSSDIIVVSGGDYKVNFSVSGTEPNQFALFLNDVMVAGTDYGSGAGTQQNSGQAILAIGANDILTLRNHTSAAAVTLAAAPPIGGTVAAVNASVLIQQLSVKTSLPRPARSATSKARVMQPLPHADDF